MNTPRTSKTTTRTALCITTLQDAWRTAMAEGRAEDVARISAAIQHASRVRLAGVSTRLALADINEAMKRMEGR